MHTHYYDDERLRFNNYLASLCNINVIYLKLGLPKQSEGICQLWDICNVFLGARQTTVNYPMHAIS